MYVVFLSFLLSLKNSSYQENNNFLFLLIHRRGQRNYLSVCFTNKVMVMLVKYVNGKIMLVIKRRNTLQTTSY